MRKWEITNKTPIKGGRFMKKFALIMVVAMIAMLVFAGFVMAAPGDYDPDNTSVWWSVYELEAGSDPDIRTADYEIFNANWTGETGVAYFGDTVGGDQATFSTFQRNVLGQLVHTDFQLNTNSCASCHMTHTAQSRKLLFRNGVFTTCTACHDGTLGFLNVFEPADGAAGSMGGSVTAGTFNVDKTRNGSVHLANGVMSISAAPGGNRTAANTTNEWDATAMNTWGNEFNCGSCHGPHGSYSIRLLHSNPNNIALRKKLTTDNESNSGGLYQVGMDADVITGVYAAPYYAKIKADGFTGGSWYYGYNRTGGVKDYLRLYSTVVADLSTKVPGTGYNANQSFTRHDGINTNFGGAYFYFKTEADLDEFAAAVKADHPAVDITDPIAFLGTLKIDAGGVVKVTADAADGYTLGNPEDVYKSDYIDATTYSGTYSKGDQYAYNLFCAACHTDYLMGQARTQGEPGVAEEGAGAGVYSKAFRHTINRGGTSTMGVLGSGGGMLCVSCHYAHGTDSSFQQLADGTLVDEPNYKSSFSAGVNEYVGANDVNHSSALKRYINMAVCWSCHSSSSATTIKNSQWYWDDYGADKQVNWH